MILYKNILKWTDYRLLIYIWIWHGVQNFYWYYKSIQNKLILNNWLNSVWFGLLGSVNLLEVSFFNIRKHCTTNNCDYIWAITCMYNFPEKSFKK